jgi:protein SCO1
LSRNVGITVALCVAFMAIIVGAFVANVVRDPVLSPDRLREQGTFLLPEPRELKLEGLTDASGKPFDESSLKGRWTFVFFGYTSCPDACPTALSTLAQVERKIGEQKNAQLASQFSVVLVSVDPERDDAEKLGRYVSAFSPHFVGVRGELDAVADFARQVNAAFMKVPGQGESYLIDHTANIVVIGPDARYRAFIRAPHEVDKIVLAYRSIAKAY